MYVGLARQNSDRYSIVEHMTLTESIRPDCDVILSSTKKLDACKTKKLCNNMWRKYISGSQKRKLAKAKKQKQCDNLANVPKLTAYFGKPPAELTCEKTCEKNPSVSNSPAKVDDSDTNEIEHNDGFIGTDDCDTDNTNTDPGFWKDFSKTDVDYWVSNGPFTCKNHTGPFDKSTRAFGTIPRSCTQNFFYGLKPNGEKYIREWLIYSPSKGLLYCFVCKLFKPDSNKFAGQGFNDWRNIRSVSHHENNSTHRECMLTYVNRRKKGKVADALEKQIESECSYWRQVLERAIAVIITLAERGLAFRGTNEQFGSPQNGNYLGVLEVIAKFDSFLATHIAKYGNPGKGNTSYLSKNICEELISEMSNELRFEILEEVKQAGYFSLSVDSTPDISHVDQLSIIIRYVSPTDGKPVERFLTFLDMQSHTGENMANLVLGYLVTECELDFDKCRGQSYDNAANMSGKYNGMQRKILDRNPLAVFIPCAGHSLNLVGKCAVDCCPKAVDFFATIQQLYNFLWHQHTGGTFW